MLQLSELGDCAMKSPFLRIHGAGDVVALVAQPLARVIDATSAAVGRPTNLQGCVKCAKKQAAWNKAVPFQKSN